MIFIKLTAITVMVVMALKIVMSEGMLMERLGFWFEKKVDEGYKIFDLFICAWCMNSLQSITAHLFAFGLGIISFDFNVHFFIRWVLVIMASSFISGNLWNLYETINRVKDRNEVEKDVLLKASDFIDIAIENCLEEYDENTIFENQHN